MITLCKILEILNQNEYDGFLYNGYWRMFENIWILSQFAGAFDPAEHAVL